MKFINSCTIFSILLSTSLSFICLAEQTSRPNILLIVLDDVGMTDIGSFGSEIKTPNIDTIADEGIKLNQFYTAPTCSPTRSMLLTGLDNHLVGMGNMHEELSPNQIGKAGYEGYLNNATINMAEVLKLEGYKTYMSGKWHLGLEEHNSPTAQGFDQSFALLHGGGGHFDDLGLFGKPALYRENGKLVSLPKDFYSTKFYTDKLISYLQQDKQSDAPFFAYLSYTAVHWPLQAPQKSIEKYKGKYEKGYENLAKSRLKNSVKKGVFPKGSQLPPLLAGEPPWDKLSIAQQQVEQRNMEIYAAMLDDVDVYIGKLFDYLKSINQFDNTLIFVMSDNGAEGHNVEHGLAELKPWIEKCCNNSYSNMGNADSYLLVGPNWTRASVGALRLYKGFGYEGGIKAPAIMKLPKNMEHKIAKNSVLSNFVSVKDVMPTFMSLANIELPINNAGQHKILPISGRNFLSPSKYIAEMGWELMGRKAYRFGDIKIVHALPPYGTGKWELYNLKSDLLEQNDLSVSNPELLKSMVVRWNEYAKANGVILPDWVSGY
jgi:arylsulfatase